MKLFDCHLHTDLSFDSREPMENYVKQAVAAGDDYFISTEHFDLESHIMDGGDIVSNTYAIIRFCAAALCVAIFLTYTSIKGLSVINGDIIKT